MSDLGNRSNNIVGAVLAGGESRRMGRDKALIDLGGLTMLGRAVAVLKSVLEQVVVVAPIREEYPSLGVDIVPDIRAGLGPLGGLHAALSHAQGAPVFVLACDMPRVSAALVRWILETAALNSVLGEDKPWSLSCQATVPQEQGRVQPLCGLYLGSCLSVVEQALDDGRLGVLDLLSHLETAKLDLDPGQIWYHSDLFVNVNDVGDFKEWTRHRSEKN